MLEFAIELLRSFAQGIGWTTGCLLTLGFLMAYEPIREYLVDRVNRKNGLKS